MAKKNWREDVDLSLKDHLEILITNVHRYRNSYKRSKNPPVAQLWCALAGLSKQILELNLKIKLMEKALKDNIKKPSHIKDVPDKDERDNLMSIAANPKKNNKKKS